MFKKGFLEAYQEVGASYLQSEHYDAASLYFLKALKLDPHHRHLQFLLNFSLGMKAYYNNAYSKALSHFSKLLSLRSKGKMKKEYLKKVEEVCYRISSELEEEKRSRAARRAGLLADQIRKCYY